MVEHIIRNDGVVGSIPISGTIQEFEDVPNRLKDERATTSRSNPPENKETFLFLGAHPDVSLRQARERRDETRRQMAAGINPSAERRASKVARALTFVDIRILDHLIVAGGDVISFAERGLI